LDHPSSGPCKQAQSTLDAALFAKKTNLSLAQDRYKEAAEAFQRIGDFTMAVNALVEGGLPASALTPNSPSQASGATQGPPAEQLPPQVIASAPPTIFVRPPTQTALDLELRRQMAEAHVEEPTDCDKSLTATKKDIDAKILKLRQEEPHWEPAPLVEVGTCTSRLHRLFGDGFGLSDTAIAIQVENREKRGCLELKKAYLDRACECTRKGIALSTDQAIQDQTLEAASAVRELETRARNRGIPNERIRAIVTRAEQVRDCYNIQTIETLRGTEQVLEKVVGPETPVIESQPPPQELRRP